MPRRWVSILLVVTAALLLIGCDGAETATSETPQATQPTAGSLTRPDTVFATVTVVPTNTVELSFRLSGVVEAVLVTTGDEVRAGQMLARLDTTYLELGVQRQEANLEVAQARLVFLQAALSPQEIFIAENNLTAAEAALSRAVAQRDEVYDDPLASQNERDAVDASVRQAVATRDSAQAELELLQAGATEEQLAVAQTVVTQAEVALEEAQMRLADAELEAPFDGTIVDVLVHPSESVVSTATAIVLADITHFYLETTDISPASVAQLQVGQPVSVWLDAFPYVMLTGSVREIALASTTLADEQATFPVYIELDDTDLPLRWGMTGMVQIETSQDP